jgi:hypothetical protein
MANNGKPQAGTAEAKPSALSDVNAKIFEGITDSDLEAIRLGIEEMRSHMNNAMAQCILLAGARANFAFTIKNGNGKGKDLPQDPRVKERARERGAAAVANLRIYLRRIGEESLAADKTIG